MSLKRKSVFFYISFVLLLLSLNPVTLSYIKVDPIPLMLAHYSIFASGTLIGYMFIESSRKLGLVGVLPAIIFHYPTLFALSAIQPTITFLDFSSICIGGMLIGASLKAIGYWGRFTLFALYMIGDTALAVIFVAGYPIYSEPSVPFSPYQTGEFVTLGYIMFLIMNVILAYVIIDFLRRLMG